MGSWAHAHIEKGFPEACIQYSLENTFPAISAGEPSNYFVKCPSDKAEPQRGQKRPQYSSYEIREIHKAFVNITDCLSIEPQALFPKLMMESGFHPTIQNPNGDAGIGQLTSRAITDVDKVLGDYKDYIWKSSKPSCRWLKSSTTARRGIWEAALPKGKCSLMTRSLNPIKNLLYVGIFHRLNMDYINSEFQRRHIPYLLELTGFPVEKADSLKRILLGLGYNTGGATAVRNLEDYLLSRYDFIQRKSHELANPIYLTLSEQERKKILASVSEDDFDFTNGLSRLEKIKKSIKENLLQQNPDMNPTDLERSIGFALRNRSSSQLTFPEWLKIWQSHGGPGYLSHLSQYAAKVEKKFGPGICSNLQFYQVR